MTRRAPSAQVAVMRAVRRAHVIVTTGAGGVGKTTTAAALGLAGARAGRRTLVLTIDPARRLAQALGLEALSDEPQPITLPPGLDGGAGELWAMMLDMQTTFDRLIDRHATSPQHAAAIKSNRIYRTLSSTLSGTNEYMAMERLYELHDTGGWDLLVIDTPPTRTALDFLDAPKRMTSFLEGRLLKLFLKPGMVAGRGYLRVVGMGATAFIKVAGKVTGMELLEDLAAFFRNFEGMYDGFKRRAAHVLDLLQQPTSQFVVVATPDPPPLREARYFLERLAAEGLHAAGVVVNRIRPDLSAAPSPGRLHAAAARLDGDHAAAAVAGALRLVADIAGLGERQRRDVAAALHAARVPTIVEVPLLSSDVHDLDTLVAFTDSLTGAVAPGDAGEPQPAAVDGRPSA